MVIQHDRASNNRLALLAGLSNFGCAALQRSVDVDPLHGSSHGKGVGFAFGRERFAELILRRWETASLASALLTQHGILGNPGSVFLPLKGFGANEAVLV